MFQLYAITPDLPAAELLAGCRAWLSLAPPGRVALQLRSKQLPIHERAELGRALRSLTHAHAVGLLVNADIELARSLGADGVQLPEHGPSVADARALLGAYASIGASRHDLAGVLAAASAGASFATLSPVFAVNDKNPALGLQGFAAIARASSLPLFALGGIDAHNAEAALRAGACGVAVIRELFASATPALALTALLHAIDRNAPATVPPDI